MEMKSIRLSEFIVAFNDWRNALPGRISRQAGFALP
jgi:hypothetical protein